LDADGLTDTIISQLRRIDSSMKNCVEKGYDGASVVAGRLSGVQKKLREKTGSEMAYYVHCYCHRLNLVIVDVVNSITCVANMIALKDTFISWHQHCTCTMGESARNPWPKKNGNWKYFRYAVGMPG
jgi:hypothetical protein